MATRLKVLLTERHWQAYPTFCRQYEKTARDIDPLLGGRWPNRTLLHGWITRGVRSRPHPDHRQVLEAMFPDWTVDELFETVPERTGPDASRR